MTLGRTVAVGLLATWAAGAGLAAAPADAPPVSSGVVERVKVYVIQLPILATDRRGRPVTDLAPSEIRVKLRGRSMKVAYLEPLRSPTTPTPTPPAVRLWLDLPGGEVEPVAATASRPSYYVFFIDTDDDDPLRREQGLEDLIDFVRALAPPVRCAVMSFDGELRVELPFTGAREAVEGALRTAWGRQAPGRLNLAARIRQLIDKFEDCVASQGLGVLRADEQCLRDVANEHAGEARPRAEKYLTALRGVVEYAAGLSGRKAVIGVTHGVAVDPAAELIEAMRAVFGNSDQLGALQLYIGWGDRPRQLMDELLRYAIQSRVTLHFVDRTPAPTGDFGARRRHPLQPGAAPLKVAFTAAQNTLEEAAASTGGVFVASTKLRAGLDQAYAAQDAGYELGFYGDEELSTAELAKISVSTSRRGVKIAHRRGYAAVSPETLGPGGARIALGQPAGAAGADGLARYPLQIAVDPRALGYRLDEAEATADLAVHVKVELDGGAPLAEAFYFVRHSYPREEWVSGGSAWLTLNGWVELPPGKFRIVTVLRNARTGWQGVISRGVRTPFAAAASPSPPIPPAGGG